MLEKQKTFLYFLIFREIGLFSFNIKKFFTFSQKKSFLISRKMETSKKLFIYQETQLSHISGSNLLYYENKKKPTLKNFLYFGKWNFLNSSLKCFLYFRWELASFENEKFIILFLIKKQNPLKYNTFL